MEKLAPRLLHRLHHSHQLALLAAARWVGIAPALRIKRQLADVHQQVALIADHLPYGFVVASSPISHRD
ncbi:hypothetical protein [Micromonospora sp. NPDC057141]